MAQRGEAGRILVRGPAGTVGMKSGSLPGTPWEKLFPRAVALIDEISRDGGIEDPFWAFGRRDRADVPLQPSAEQGHRYLPAPSAARASRRWRGSKPPPWHCIRSSAVTAVPPVTPVADDPAHPGAGHARWPLVALLLLGFSMPSRWRGQGRTRFHHFHPP